MKRKERGGIFPILLPIVAVYTHTHTPFSLCLTLFLTLCVYVYLFIYLYIYIYKYIYVCISINIYISINMYIYRCIYKSEAITSHYSEADHLCVRACACTRMYSAASRRQKLV